MYLVPYIWSLSLSVLLEGSACQGIPSPWRRQNRITPAPQKHVFNVYQGEIRYSCLRVQTACFSLDCLEEGLSLAFLEEKKWFIFVFILGGPGLQDPPRLHSLPPLFLKRIFMHFVPVAGTGLASPSPLHPGNFLRQLQIK
uniref:Uncharacterized protein n=1 Tax=Micrurus lemniscatus lemniscatus TaxID=129467 RepID=A0A2D4JFU2_MICLE